MGKYFCEKYKDHDITGIDIVEGNDARDFFKHNEEYYDLVIHLAAVVGGRATIEGSPLSVAVDLSDSRNQSNLYFFLNKRIFSIIHFG